MGKKGTLAQYQRANAFLLEPLLVPKVFKELAARYAERPGGYTRIHKFGNRPGDNAPHAILELVDNPRDIKFEMTARTIGWEVLSKQVAKCTPQQLAETGVKGLQKVFRGELKVQSSEQGFLKEKTRWNLQKVLKFRNPEALAVLQDKAEDHIVCAPTFLIVADSFLSRTHFSPNLLLSRR
jgi:large subunit ribosomal protein L17